MIDRDVYAHYFTNLLAGRRSACVDTVKRLVDDGLPVRTVYIHLIQKTLYDVGSLWEQNRITVADEHLATAISEMAITVIYPHVFARERTGRRAVVSCVANEYHQIGGKMIADVFEMNGWDGYFLGANTPVSDLLDFIDDTSPDFVGLSLAIPANMHRLEHAVTAVRSHSPNIPVIIGGQAFLHGGTERFDGDGMVSFVESIDRLESFITGH